MSTAPANVNEPTESVIATSDFAELKFNAFEALARLYAARGSFEPKPSSHVSSSTGGLDTLQAEHWLFAQAFLSEANSSFNLTLEHAKFGAKGWMALTRDKDKTGCFVYVLKVVHQNQGKLVLQKEIGADCVADAVRHGHSLLAAALANYPDVAIKCAQALLDGAALSRVEAGFEASFLEQFIADVVAPTGTPRQTRI